MHFEELQKVNRYMREMKKAFQTRGAIYRILARKLESDACHRVKNEDHMSSRIVLHETHHHSRNT